MPLLRTPRARFEAYRAGLRGAFIDADTQPAKCRKIARYECDRMMAELPMPVLAAAAAGIEGIGKGKLSLPYHYYQKEDPAHALFGAQLTGDCVGWGTRTAVDTERCCAIAAGEPEAYLWRMATALIYGDRGHRGQGMSGATAARSVRDHGLLLEQAYLDGQYDFTNYEEYVKLAIAWGGRGAPEELLAITRQNTVGTITLATGMDELCDATATGTAAACCSDIGVATTWGADFIARLSGSWAHCMAIIGCDDRRKYSKKRLWIWDQSWGKWGRGPWPADYGPRPQGAFILDEDDTWRAVRQRGTWLFRATVGFKPRKLPDLGFYKHLSA